MELKECGKKLNIDSFSEVENLLRGFLPKEYKEFMLEHNGGRPIKRLALSFMEYDPEKNEIFENELDIYSFNKLEDIPSFYDNLFSSELIPEHYCPIADDSCGNEVLLCVKEGENYGKIYFANHELFYVDESWVITKIADNFNSFLELLQESI